MGSPVEFVPFAPHHLYIGIFFVVLSVLMLPHRLYRPWMWFFFIGGLFLVIDDWVEHTLTDCTPVRLLVEWIVRVT